MIRKRTRVISILLAVMLAFTVYAVPVSAATDIVYITNGGRELYFPGSTFMMKGQIANNGIGLSGVSALIQAQLSNENEPFFTAAPETDEEGYFTTGFNIPEDAVPGTKMYLMINGDVSKTFEIEDFAAAIAADEDIRLELLGFTSGSEGSVGYPDESVTVSSSLDSFGLVFTRNVNYFADNNSPLEVTSLGENSRNADCFTLYEGDKEVECSVSLLADGGYGTVNYLTTDGEKESTTERNVIYVKPQTSLKADTQYRLVIDEMLTGNNNVHLDGDLTVYFQTAAQDENIGGGGGAGGGTVAEPENPDEEKPDEPENPGEGSADFADVPEGAWYTDAVDYVVSKGLFKGVSESQFSPDGQMSRAMFATVLARMSGEDVTGYSSSFTDVAAGLWYTDSIAWGYSKGLMNGLGNGLFGPDNGITREQIAVLLYNFEVYKGGDVSSVENNSYAQMKDAADVSSWAEKAMSWAYEQGIIQGNDLGQLQPKGLATRAQVAAMLMRTDA